MNMNRVEYIAHEPVMANEVLKLLENINAGTLIDATYGAGAHFDLIKTKYPKFNVLGIDRDNDSVSSAKENNSVFKYNFAELDRFVQEKKLKQIKCIFFDFGVSTHQIMNKDRGFSFQNNSDLDMRMDKGEPLSAKDFINSASKEEIILILRIYGEENHAYKIANMIVESRPFKKTSELSESIARAVPVKNPLAKKKSIRRCFQAIRIHINDELTHIDNGLVKSIDIIDSGGMIITISYHSLEDKIVKRIFKENSIECVCPNEIPKCMCNQKPKIKLGKPSKLKPSKAEITKNRKSKSAILRYAVKL